MTQQQPRHVVVMGVSGSGKSSVGRALADRLGFTFLDADSRHSAAAIASMAAGRPLTESMRHPWLTGLASWTREQHDAGRSTVLACSALRRSHRDLLRDGDLPTTFVHVTADPAELHRRMRERTHFMPPALLDSQLATLEPLEPDEDAVEVHGRDGVEATVDAVLTALGERDVPSS